MRVQGTADTGDQVPRRVDATAQQVVSLLELVRREDEVLAQLSGYVAELRAIRAARSALLDVTTVELVEARDVLREFGSAAASRVDGEFVWLGVDGGEGS